MAVIRLRGRSAPTTAFVLGGGGNLGAIQVGMLEALVERGIRPDLVLGCSVGALNGAALARQPDADGVAHLRKVWLSLRTEDVFPAAGRFTAPWMLFRKGLGMHPNHGVRALIERFAGFDRFEDAVARFEVVATSLDTGRDRWFTSGPIVEPILASAALPAVFPPVTIDGERYIDGGVVDNVPISRAVALGAQRIYVLHVGNFERPRNELQRPLDVLLQAFSIARNYRFKAESVAAPDGVELITLPGVDPGPMKRHDFTRTAALVERARAAAATYLDDLAPAATAPR